jgi:hypothetical protein
VLRPDDVEAPVGEGDRQGVAVLEADPIAEPGPPRQLADPAALR